MTIGQSFSQVYREQEVGVSMKGVVGNVPV